MPDTAIDITDLLHDIDPQRITYIAQSDRVRYHAAIKALVAERDALQSKIDSMNEAMHSIARRQVALEEEAEERQSIGLRERLVCAIWPEIMRQWREYKDAIDPRGYARSDALEEADKMLAAMRKGVADA